MYIANVLESAALYLVLARYAERIVCRVEVESARKLRAVLQQNGDGHARLQSGLESADFLRRDRHS